MRWLWLLVTLEVFFLNTTKVTAFDFNEMTDGDLPTFSQDSAPFTLNYGVNTFSGEVTFSFNEGIPTDFDSFAFIVPTGNTLDSITVDISLIPGGSGIFNRTVYSIDQNFFQQEIPIPSMDLSLFTSLIPLENGLFALENLGLVGELTEGQFQTAAYTFSLNVVEPESIPEPSVFMGFIVSSLSFLLKKRR